MIAIIDYGMGNLQSIKNMLKELRVQAIITSTEDEIFQAEKLIFPGVGAFNSGFNNINSLGLIPVLTRKVILEKTPILGICLGMQLFSKKSEEGDSDGLGWIKARTVRFSFDQPDKKLKIPHMGWNTIPKRKDEPFLNGMDEESRFYFVHSYHLVCDNPDDVIAETHHGYFFPSIIRHNNIFGVQFHPEKSHKYGMRLLSNFAKL